MCRRLRTSDSDHSMAENAPISIWRCRMHVWLYVCLWQEFPARQEYGTAGEHVRAIIVKARLSRTQSGVCSVGRDTYT